MRYALVRAHTEFEGEEIASVVVVELSAEFITSTRRRMKEFVAAKILDGDLRSWTYWGCTPAWWYKADFEEGSVLEMFYTSDDEVLIADMRPETGAESPRLEMEVMVVDERCVVWVAHEKYTGLEVVSAGLSSQLLEDVR